MKTRIFIAAFIVVISVVVVLFMQRTSLGVVLLDQAAPVLLPSSQLARNLESSETDLVRESLGLLRRRHDPIAIQQALPLLQSPDDYVWLNAAEYLGSVGRTETIPYLIKALRHTAWRADTNTLAFLQSITGQTFSADFRTWSNWWVATHFDAGFDFNSHLGHNPRQ